LTYFEGYCAMRREVLWTLVLLGMPQVAAADGAMGAAVPPVLPGGDAALERAKPSGKADQPSLDLRIDDAMSAALPPIVPGGALALEHTETPGEAIPPDLDSWTDQTQLPASANAPDGAGASGGDRADRDAEPSVADRGLSFGFEVKPRSPMGALARQHEPEEPGFSGQLERLIERPSFGVRGRYRF
jgi:hypothetical protein